MTIKIDGTMPIPERRKRASAFREVCEAIGRLKVGQSFYTSQKLYPNYVTAISHAMRRRFRVQREGKGWRVGRIA